jgi:hypothetical protein
VSILFFCLRCEKAAWSTEDGRHTCGSGLLTADEVLVLEPWRALKGREAT